MSEQLEYDCADCGRHVIAFLGLPEAFLGLPEAAWRCGSCQWIRDNVAPGGQAAVRERLGVPLAASRFACPRCGAVSHHPQDVLEGYCGRCHDWTAPPRRERELPP
jgi:ribosomal protein S27AE